MAVPEFKALVYVSMELPLKRYLAREGIDELASIKVLDKKDGGQLDEHGPKTFKIGHFWNKTEFLEQANGMVHPFDRIITVPTQVAKTWTALATMGPNKMIQRRKEILRHYKARAKHLSLMEQELHKALPLHVEKVVKNKRVLLSKEMLDDMKYDDPDVADLLIKGVRVVGCLEQLSICPTADNSPKC